MKIKTFFPIFFLIFVVVTGFYWRKIAIRETTLNHLKVTRSQDSETDLESLSTVISTIATPYQKVPTTNQVNEPLIKNSIKNRLGGGAYEASEAMEKFLKSWNPAGRTSKEIKEILGLPDREKPNSLTYLFDDGRGGDIFVFEFRNGICAGLTRPPSE